MNLDVKRLLKNMLQELLKLEELATEKNISIGTKRYMDSRTKEEIESFSESCKNAYHEKVIKTNLERYGVEHYFLLSCKNGLI